MARAGLPAINILHRPMLQSRVEFAVRLDNLVVRPSGHLESKNSDEKPDPGGLCRTEPDSRNCPDGQRP
jgi:hypothetical protein